MEWNFKKLLPYITTLHYLKKKMIWHVKLLECCKINLLLVSYVAVVGVSGVTGVTTCSLATQGYLAS